MYLYSWHLSFQYLWEEKPGWLNMNNSSRSPQKTEDTGQGAFREMQDVRFSYLEEMWLRCHKMGKQLTSNFDELLETECELSWEKLLGAAVLLEPTLLQVFLLATHGAFIRRIQESVILAGEEEEKILSNNLHDILFSLTKTSLPGWRTLPEGNTKISSRERTFTAVMLYPL